MILPWTLSFLRVRHTTWEMRTFQPSWLRVASHINTQEPHGVTFMSRRSPANKNTIPSMEILCSQQNQLPRDLWMLSPNSRQTPPAISHTLGLADPEQGWNSQQGPQGLCRENAASSASPIPQCSQRTKSRQCSQEAPTPSGSAAASAQRGQSPNSDSGVDPPWGGSAPRVSVGLLP